MTIADDMRADIAEALAEYGRTITYTRPGTATYDSATGGTTEGEPTEVAALGLILGYRDRDVDGTRVRTGDRKLILNVKEVLAAGIAQPAPGDTVSAPVDGVEQVYCVGPFKTVELVGTSVLWVCQLRKGGFE